MTTDGCMILIRNKETIAEMTHQIGKLLTVPIIGNFGLKRSLSLYHMIIVP